VHRECDEHPYDLALKLGDQAVFVTEKKVFV